MARLKIKTIIKVLFFAVVSVAVLFQLAGLYARWQTGRQIRAQIRANAIVEVLEIDPRFPPGLLLAYENGSAYKIDKTVFKLSFWLAGQEVASTERDFREMRPGEREHVLLESVAVPPAAKPPAPGTELTYHLLVYPGQRNPLPELKGEIVLR
jgi:hypothetical protein